MQPLARKLMGIITSVLWLGMGGYMVFYGATQTWRLVGFAVIAVGVLRAALLVRQFRQSPDD